MGFINAMITLKNPKKSDFKPITVQALVDTGALTLCIPESLCMQMGFEELEKREVFTADGKSHLVSYVGPIQLQFENRNCFTGAMVIEDQILLSAIPLEDMDLVIIPSTRTLSVNPNSPNIPTAIVK